MTLPPQEIPRYALGAAANFQKLGIYILNGFNEEIYDTFNDKNIELWSVTKELLSENNYFLNCTLLESLLIASSPPLNKGG